MGANASPLIVGIGGTTRPGSSSEQAVRFALAAAEAAGARTRIFAGHDLQLPLYAPESAVRSVEARDLVETLRTADGIILASPAYHGGISGLIKNAIDYVEDMRDDERVYFDGRAVGCVTCAYGIQAAGTTLVALRSIVHSLRGWPAPLGVAINSSNCRFGSDHTPSDSGVADQLGLMARQVTRFAHAMQAASDDGTTTGSRPVLVKTG